MAWKRNWKCWFHNRKVVRQSWTEDSLVALFILSREVCVSLLSATLVSSAKRQVYVLIVLWYSGTDIKSWHLLMIIWTDERFSPTKVVVLQIQTLLWHFIIYVWLTIHRIRDKLFRFIYGTCDCFTCCLAVLTTNMNMPMVSQICTILC